MITSLARGLHKDLCILHLAITLCRVCVFCDGFDGVLRSQEITRAHRPINGCKSKFGIRRKHESSSPVARAMAFMASFLALIEQCKFHLRFSQGGHHFRNEVR